MLRRSKRLAEARQRYAEGLRDRCGLRSEALVQALAEVARERFLPRGPWLLLETEAGYASTPDADPIHLYRDVAVGIDPTRLINNSQPSLLASLVDALEIQPGERVVHVGCATGYYTAILAHLVGRRGSVVAIEIDPRLQTRARRSLRTYKQVEVIHADAFEYDPGVADAILVDGGVTHPHPRWLDRLRAGGRLAVPLTAVRPPSRLSRIVRNDTGRALVVRRTERGYAARFHDGLAIAALYGGKDPERQRRLEEAYARGNTGGVRSLRRDDHGPGPSCWFHSPGFCLSSDDSWS